MTADRMETAPRVLPRAVVILIGVAAAVIVIAGLRQAASIVGPALLALVLTIGVQPMRIWLRRLGLPTWATVTVTLVVVYGTVLGFVGAIGWSLARFATLLPTYSQKFDDLLNQGRRWLGQFGVSQEQVRSAADIDPNRVTGVVTTLLGGTAGALSALVLVLTLALFMVVDASGFLRRLDVVSQAKPAVAEALSRFSEGTRKYLVVSTVFGLIVAVLDVGALWLLGVPLPIVWGLLSFLTNYIPNVGFVLGLVPPALLGLLEGGPVTMLLVIVAYSVINFVVQTVIQPKFVGDTANLSMTLAMASLVFWAWVLGPFGALLAIPLTLLAKAVLVDTDPRAQWLDTLISNSGTGEAATESRGQVRPAR